MHASPSMALYQLARCAAFLALLGTPAFAQETIALSTPPRNTADGQLLLALPAALATGMSSGVGAGFLHTWARHGALAFGGRASWSTATEYSFVDSVRNDDIRLRLCGVLQHPAGRGTFGLRLGLGATVVYESHTRAQGQRAGLSGSELTQTSWYVFPAADLDVLVVVRVWNAWGVSISGGPTLHLIDGAARFGWAGGLGVVWQP